MKDSIVRKVAALKLAMSLLQTELHLQFFIFLEAATGGVL